MNSEVLAVICSIFSGIAIFLMKIFWKKRNIALLFLSIFLHVASAFIFVLALREAKLSLLYPLLSLAYLWSSLLAWTFLKEKLFPSRIVGILLILAGIYLVLK